LGVEEAADGCLVVGGGGGGRGERVYYYEGGFVEVYGQEEPVGGANVDRDYEGAEVFQGFGVWWAGGEGFVQLLFYQAVELL